MGRFWTGLTLIGLLCGATFVAGGLLLAVVQFFVLLLVVGVMGRVHNQALAVEARLNHVNRMAFAAIEELEQRIEAQESLPVATALKETFH